MTMIARLTGDGGKIKLLDPRPGKGVQVFEKRDMEHAMEVCDAVNAEIAAVGATAPAATMKVKGGKATVYVPEHGYKGQLFSGYAADFEALIAYFGASPESQGVSDFAEIRPYICASWQAFGDLAVGATLPDGSVKQPKRA